LSSRLPREDGRRPTGTLEVKREVVVAHFAAEIEAMYRE